MPDYILAKSTNPHSDGRYGRAGLRFTREWRPLEISDVADLERSVIDAEIARRLDKDPFLVTRPATADEVAKLAETAAAAAAGSDPAAELAALRKQNADLEARLMRLELGAGGSTDADQSADKPAKPKPSKG